jgi:hypothetical protein
MAGDVKIEAPPTFWNFAGIILLENDCSASGSGKSTDFLNGIVKLPHIRLLDTVKIPDLKNGNFRSGCVENLIIGLYNRLISLIVHVDARRLVDHLNPHSSYIWKINLCLFVNWT